MHLHSNNKIIEFVCWVPIGHATLLRCAFLVALSLVLAYIGLLCFADRSSQLFIDYRIRLRCCFPCAIVLACSCYVWCLLGGLSFQKRFPQLAISNWYRAAEVNMVASITLGTPAGRPGPWLKASRAEVMECVENQGREQNLQPKFPPEHDAFQKRSSIRFENPPCIKKLFCHLLFTIGCLFQKETTEKVV